MAKTTSIVVSAKDNFTVAVTSMRTANQAFRKDLESTKIRLDDLNRQKYELKVDAELAKSNLNEARKAFRNAEEGTDSYQRALDRLKEAHFNQDQITDQLKQVSAAAKEAQNDINALNDTGRKLDNRAGAPAAQGGVLSTLAGAGAAKMIGDLIGNTASTYVGSAYGRETGTYFNSALSSGAMGAAIGTAIAPVIGTAVGAALGGIAGLIEGKRKIFEAQDDSFRGYYQNLYDETTGAQKQSLTSGTVTAANQERDLQRIETLLRGDADAARAFQEEIKLLGSTPPFSYEALLDISTGMLSLGKSTDEVRARINNLVDAGAALNLSGSDVSGLVSLLDTASEMGKIDTRVVRTLLKQYDINVKEALAGAFREELSGTVLSADDVLKTLDKLDVDDVIDAIYRYMGDRFAGSADRAAESYLGLQGQLDFYKSELDKAMGEAFNAERSRGLTEQISWLSGGTGENMKEAYAQIGQWQASLENLQEQMQRDALTAVMTGAVPGSLKGTESEKRINELAGEYAELSKSGTEEAGAKMGAVLAEAQAIAINEYNASEGAQLQLNTQLDIADRIRADAALNEKYFDAGYRMGEQFSKGMKSAIPPLAEEALDPSARAKISGAANILYGGGGFAYGLDRVPYDNFPALLHEGEKVQTAREARNNGNAAPFEININGTIIREEADIDRLAKEIVTQITQAQMLAV